VPLRELYKNYEEIVYGYSDLFLPEQSKHKKMMDYLAIQMHNQFDTENEAMRTKKRLYKAKLKQLQRRIKHLANHPSPDYADLEKLNKQMTSEDLKTDKERLLKEATHIAKIVPTKRVQSTHKAYVEFQKDQMMQQIQQSSAMKPVAEKEIKMYLEDDMVGISSMSTIPEWEKEVEAMSGESVEKSKLIRQRALRFLDISEKVRNEGIQNLTPEERQDLKEEIGRQAKQAVDGMYPSQVFKQTDKECYAFLNDLSQKDYSYKGQASAIQSFDLADDHQPGLGLSFADERETMHSQESAHRYQEQSDKHIQQLQIDNEFKRYPHFKRVKYWGELSDCRSKAQLKADQVRLQIYKARHKVKEVTGEVFAIKEGEPGKQDFVDFTVSLHKKSEPFQRITVNDIMRRVKRECGMIEEEEFNQ